MDRATLERIIRYLMGVGTGGDVSGGVSLKYSPNAPTICDLTGPFGNASIGGGAGPHGAGDYFWGTGRDGNAISGVGATFGAGVGAGGSVTGTFTGVTVWGQL
jgi:hypothetical protein